MDYPRLLALIDAELDRLRRARLLLASSLGSAEKAARKRALSGARRTIRAVPETKQIASLPEETGAQPEPVPETEAVPRKQTKPVRRRSRPATQAATAAAFVSPLAGIFPSVPVFVTARKVQEMHSARQAAATPEAGDPQATENLSAEVLRQRWLQK